MINRLTTHGQLFVILITTFSVMTPAWGDDTVHATTDFVDDLTTEPATALAEWDQAWTRLRKTIWDTQNIAVVIDYDLRARRLSDDLRSYVLTATTEQSVLQLRAQAERAIQTGKSDVAKRLLTELRSHVEHESKQLADITNYWLMYQQQVGRYRALWKQAAAATANYQTPTNISQAELELIVQLNTGNFASTLMSNFMQLMQLYADERGRMVSALSQPTAVRDPHYFKRRTECVTTTQQTSRGPTAKFIGTTQPIYPPQSQRGYAEGTVTLNIAVGSNGCVNSYGIAQSSGWIVLDDAAIEWLETAPFLPGESNGKAVESVIAMPLTFKLAD